MVLDVYLLKLAPVLHGDVVQEVLDVGFLHLAVAFVLLVFEDRGDRGRSPVVLMAWGLYTSLFQHFADAVHRLPFEELPVDEPYDRRLLLVDLKADLGVLVLVVTQESAVADLRIAVDRFLLLAPLDVLGYVP